jgi:hypothetical protein
LVISELALKGNGSKDLEVCVLKFRAVRLSVFIFFLFCQTTS